MSETGTIVKNGLWDNNVIFVQLLGMCPLLGVSTNAVNGIGMGLATTFVLVGSNVVVSWVRNFIPNDIRIPAFVIIIASFVTVVDLMMNAFFLSLHKVLGIFIPLIVVNCAILGRAEAFACKNKALPSVIDGLSTGLGFTLALFILGSCRELLGSGKLFGMDVLGPSYHPAIGFILPPGAFIVLGFILVAVRWLNARQAKA
ncbi:MAG: electron transport complex subunit E [Magnetococcales bacterium]|nr:electron transport complex subunit E [Magnetococcales bacterium]MBF0322389.1 electron transport complex subunit E [Magnetococcales bacterium]